MKHLLAGIVIVLLSAVSSAPLFSQGAAVNVASFANPNLPNGDLAQGGMFTVFASNIGPASLAQATSFPLPTELGGTSVQVAVGGQTLDCIMVFSVGGQAAAILPSATPLGDGTMTVRFNGQVRATFSVTVVAHSFGIFSINQQGNGPGVITDASAFLPNTVLNAANPGEAWIIWGTGLGAVQGDEAGGPLPGALPYSIKVFVGDKEAQVIAGSRSGCCAGVDQVAFFVPEDISGCYVPVYVVVEGVTSNFATMAIAPSGDFCSEPGLGLTPDLLSQAQQTGGISFGSINLARQRISFSAAPAQEAPNRVEQDFSFTSDNFFANYTRYNASELIRFSGLTDISTIGSCTVFQFTGTEAETTDLVTGTGLDAGGSLQIQGPASAQSAPRGTLGNYFKSLSQPNIPIPSFIRHRIAQELAGVGKLPSQKDQFSQPSFLEPGNFTVTAPGGADVGPHTANITVDQPFTWTNRDDINAIDRTRPLEIKYSGGSPDRQIRIFGFSPHSVEGENISGALFFCAGAGNATSFTIPSAVLQALPDSPLLEGSPTGGLAVAGVKSNPFSASGIDLGTIEHADRDLKPVDFN